MTEATVAPLTDREALVAVGPSVGDRRRPQTTANCPDEVLRRLPGLALLDRMSAAIIGIGLDGVVAYANPACAAMLGFDRAQVVGQHVTALLCAPMKGRTADCIPLLHDQGTVVQCRHAEGYPVAVSVSGSIPLRAADPMAMLCLSDVSDSVWNGFARASH